MNGIYWLASYPKSGNTWMRIFLANYLDGGHQPISINELSTSLAADRSIFDEETGLESSLLSSDESMRLRPFLYERLSVGSEENRYLKIHDACIEAFCGMPVTSIKGTAGALYIIRNPLDVAVSWADFNRKTIDQAISDLGNKDFTLCGKSKRAVKQLLQPLHSWSGHVESWADNPWSPVEIIRYEDMKSDPASTFFRVVDFLNLPFDESRLQKAIAHSEFGKLKKQEQQMSFRESSPFAPVFFRNGDAGGWRKTLTTEQVGRVVEEHKTVMQRFGYLNDAIEWLNGVNTA